MPRYAVAFMIFMLASVGLPGTSGFVGEFLVLLGTFQVNTWAAFLATTGAILSAAYMLYLYRRVVFGTIACLTDSILPALPVHVVGDVIFFTLIWPHDAARPLVGEQGPDLWFWTSISLVIVFGLLALLAFRRLAGLRIAFPGHPEREIPDRGGHRGNLH